jgi:hypothetical protein
MKDDANKPSLPRCVLLALAVLHRQAMASSKVRVDRSVHCTFEFMAAPVTKHYTRHVYSGLLFSDVSVSCKL